MYTGDQVVIFPIPPCFKSFNHFQSHRFVPNSQWLMKKEGFVTNPIGTIGHWWESIWWCQWYTKPSPLFLPIPSLSNLPPQVEITLLGYIIFRGAGISWSGVNSPLKIGKPQEVKGFNHHILCKCQCCGYTWYNLFSHNSSGNNIFQ